MMAPTAAAVLWFFISSTIMMHSVYGAPVTDKNDHNIIEDTNLVTDGEIHKFDDNKTSEFSLLKNGLFEGDIKVSEDLIYKYYDLSDLPGEEGYNGTMLQGNNNDIIDDGKQKRAAGRNSNDLWPNARVPYQFSSGIWNDLRLSIRDAMDHWEDHTCLRFTFRNGQSDYVEYVNEDPWCWSNLGKDGGRQKINMNRDHGCGYGTIVHEIGHTVGFWHEQSRPDRDYYIRVICSNIDIEKRSQFMKRKYSEVDSLGSEYDYGSVMHYETSKFAREGCGCNSMEVINSRVYRAQGSPTIGDWSDGLSSRDIQQANSLYSCPRSGVTGLLEVYVRNARSLPDTDPILNSPDPYVRITAVDSTGTKYVRDTTVKDGSTSPTWNEYLTVVDREWQFFRIQIWDDDDGFTFGDDQMSVSDTIVVTSGNHNSLTHYSRLYSSNGYVSFDYTLHQLTRAALSVYVRYARNLDDTDPIWNSPDPYVTVKTTSSSGERSLSTHYIDGTENPTWNKLLNFGCQRWVNHIEVQVWDSDSFLTGADDPLSTKERITISSGHHGNNRHNAHGSGYLIFNYDFIIDGNECNSHACQNGGTCVDGCARYSCSCPPRYTGTYCEHLSGNLRFKARYARNLRDSDPLWNDSDPYMEIIAVDENGNSVTKSTRYLNGDSNPDWNEWLYFGTRGWKKFKVRIYDSDYNADDALSSQYIWNVASGSHTDLRFDCYDGGHAVFDYYFD